MLSNTTSVAALAKRYQSQISQQRNPFTLRMHRALSWLQRAETAGDDDDVAFICLWIAFNAAYAQDLGDGASGTSRRHSECHRARCGGVQRTS